MFLLRLFAHDLWAYIISGQCNIFLFHALSIWRIDAWIFNVTPPHYNLNICMSKHVCLFEGGVRLCACVCVYLFLWGVFMERIRGQPSQFYATYNRKHAEHSSFLFFKWTIWALAGTDPSFMRFIFLTEIVRSAHKGKTLWLRWPSELSNYPRKLL